MKLIEGDCTLLSNQYIKSSSVDLIYTDPPYPKKYHHLYKWLAQESIRVLKPSGFLMVYVGPYWKNIIMDYFNKELQYFYDFIMVHKGNTSILWHRKIISGYKSILCYHLKEQKPLPKTNMLGKYDGNGADKRYHKWGQDALIAKYHIECLTNPGDLVVDYFMGGGTVPEVCKRLNRDFIGFESDHISFNTTVNRVNNGLINETSNQGVMKL